MELSELQRLLIHGLIVCNLEQDDIIAALTILNTEEKQWAAAKYLKTVVHNPPEAQAVFKEIATIAA